MQASHKTLASDLKESVNKMMLVLTASDREEFLNILKHSDSATIEELIIKRVVKRLTKHDICEICDIDIDYERNTERLLIYLD